MLKKAVAAQIIIHCASYFLVPSYSFADVPEPTGTVETNQQIPNLDYDYTINNSTTSEIIIEEVLSQINDEISLQDSGVSSNESVGIIQDDIPVEEQYVIDLYDADVIDNECESKSLDHDVLDDSSFQETSDYEESTEDFSISDSALQLENEVVEVQDVCIEELLETDNSNDSVDLQNDEPIFESMEDENPSILDVSDVDQESFVEEQTIDYQTSLESNLDDEHLDMSYQELQFEPLANESNSTADESENSVLTEVFPEPSTGAEDHISIDVDDNELIEGTDNTCSADIEELAQNPPIQDIPSRETEGIENIDDAQQTTSPQEIEETNNAETVILEQIEQKAIEVMASNTLASGIWGSCLWEIDADNVLTIHSGIGLDTNNQSPWKEYAKQITSIVIELENGQNVILPNDSSFLFEGFNHLTSLNLVGIDTSNTTNISYMFAGCASLTSLDLSGFDTTIVQDAFCFFQGCSSLAYISVGSTFVFKDDLPSSIINNHSDWYSTTSMQWFSSSEITASRSYISDIYIKDPIITPGWHEIDGLKYYEDDTGIFLKGWQKIDNACYYFDKTTGAMRTSWIKDNNSWYYLDLNTGVMLTGWFESGDSLYYLLPSGKMSTGWQKIDGTWYYFAGSGKMQTGWLVVGSGTYYLSANGIMVTGWQKIDGTWYYFAGSGKMQTGWQKINNVWYYLDLDTGAMLTGWFEYDGSMYYYLPSGKMSTGWQKIDGSWYYFDGSGKMQTGWLVVSSGTYYLNTDGKMSTGWQKIDDSWYYFASSGKMRIGWLVVSSGTYYLNTDGKMLTGWQKIDGSWYYFASNGKMQTGWQKINNVWYYMDLDTGVMLTGWLEYGNGLYYLLSSGKMSTGWQKIDGFWYYFASNGKMHTGWLVKGSKQYYLDKQSGKMLTGIHEILGITYSFNNKTGALEGRIDASGVVNAAYACLGIPYVWGGTTTDGFDCSGLTQYCYAVCGYSISRTTYTQIAEIQSKGNWVTDESLLQPGDLVFPHSGQVMVYIGNGKVIHAPYPGTVVQIADLYSFMGGGSPI